MRVHIFKLSDSHLLCFMVSWVLSDLANRIIFVVRQCPLGPFRSRFAPCHDQWPFICRHLPACRLAAVISHSSLWLVWHISLLLSSSKSPKQGSCWRVDVLVCEDSGYLLKYGCEGNTLLWRRSSTSTSSRVARFDDIFDFGLWMYHFHVYVLV